jgi:hypothetical protein
MGNKWGNGGCRRNAGAAALMVAAVVAACTAGGPSEDVNRAIAEKVAKLSRQFGCGHARPHGGDMGALVAVPHDPDRIAVVDAARAADYVGPGKYTLLSWCAKRPG